MTKLDQFSSKILGLVIAFGPAFAGLPLDRPLTLPGGMLKLIDRVTELDPQGGRFGLGRIRTEVDIRPNDWFLTCHFVDDMEIGDFWCAEHDLHGAILHLREAARMFREWQGKPLPAREDAP